MDAKAQFHLPSIMTDGSPAVLAMRAHGRRCIHHHSLLSGVGREVQLDVVHTGGCDALPGGLEHCSGDVDADNPAGRRGPLRRFERRSAKP
jgi:hypothetical protein